MWSLSEWKKRWNWFHSFWQRYKPKSPSLMVVSAAGLAVAAFLAVAYRSWPDPLDWLENGHEGKIIINSPTVYTRQRLVNDRLSQTQWLQEQLKAAEGIGDSPNFRSIDQVRHSLDDRSTQLGVSNTGQLTKAASEHNPADLKSSESQAGGNTNKGTFGTEDVSVAPTTVELFRAKNAFRNLVRTEMMQTDLDDRHDIQGNTVYRLAFDATILAGTRKDSLAVINVVLSHEPKTPAEKELYRADYEQLYTDWIRYMQNFLSESSENIANLLVTGNFEPRLKSLKSLISRFMVGRVCEFLLDRYSLNESSLSERVDRRCDPGAGGSPAEQDQAAQMRLKAERFIKSYIDLHIGYQEKITEGEFKKALSEKVNPRFKEALLEKNEIPTEFKGAFSNARNLCKTHRFVGVLDLGIPEEYLKVPPKTDLPEAPGGMALDPNAPRGEPISCPKNISTNVRLIAEIFLYNRMLDLLSANTTDDDRKSKLSVESLGIDSIRQGCPAAEGDISNDFIFSNCAPPTLELPEALCFAADFLRANLNAFDRPQAPDSQRIGFFLKLGIVGREVKDCRLSVSRSDSTKSAESLREFLNKNTEVFSYGVSPKSLSQSIATASEVRDAFQMIASMRLGLTDRYPEGFANELRRHTDQVEMIQNHPIVVGFGSGYPVTYADTETAGSPSTIVSRTTFGWIVAPQFETDKNPHQIDAQYDLAAVVSVPSWWRSARLDIHTCWVSRKDLQLSRRDLSGVDQTEICKGDDVQPVTLNVRLPGMIQELSRKLGFEAIQEPYLSGAQKFQVLEIGQPGWLLLTGGRLWRSTEVTLGAQRADGIVVLPNMEGIIARFNCVEPQWGQYGGQNGGQNNSAVGATQPTPAQPKTPSSPSVPPPDGKMPAELPSNTEGTNPYSSMSTATNTTVRVWTSEGVAETDTVSLIWPNLWNQEKPDNKAKPDQGTSSRNPAPPAQIVAGNNVRELLEKTRFCPDRSRADLAR